MAHIHSVYDNDTHFKIDHVTRGFSNEGSLKTLVVQNDHNSERFTFELPRFIEGHDMLVCNRVEVHYLNTDTSTKEYTSGVYEVDDLQESPNDENVAILSWLLSNNATKHVGTLNFVIRFACLTGDTIDYAWNTVIYDKIHVTSGIYNSDEVVEIYADVLEKWKQELETQEIDLSNYYTKDEVNQVAGTFVTKNEIETMEQELGVTLQQMQSSIMTETQVRTLIDEVITDALNSEV